MTSKHSSHQPDDGSDTLERRLDIVVTQGTPSPGSSFLLVVAGENAGKLFPLNKPVLLIGRSPNADIRINEKAVSHHHARLHLDNGICTLRDLESTNGTFVNNELIAGSVRLRGGDAVGVGSTTFTYLAGTEASSDQTIQLRNQGASAPPPPVGSFIDAVRQQPSMAPSFAHAQAVPLARQVDDESVSLTDVLRKMQAYWVYTKRYGWLVLACTLFGVAAGILNTRMNPPPGSAWFEMTLINQGNANPMNREAETAQFFVSAESAFRALPLIKKTMEELGVPNLSDTAAGNIQQQLLFEKQGYQSQLWRGEYKDVDSQRAAQFLKKHLEVYLETEIDKTLKVIRTSTEFLTNQLADARSDLRTAEAKLLQFRDEHPEAIPKDAQLPNPLKSSLQAAMSVRDQLTQVTNEITATRAKLAAGTSVQRNQLEKSKRFEDQVLAIRGKIAEAKARGMTDQHPEVQRLRQEEAQLLKLQQQTAAQEASEAEKRLDAETLALKDKLAQLTAQQQKLQQQLGVATKKVDEQRLESLPELQARYQDLSRDYEAKRKKHDTLVADLETKKMQLEMERASGRAHYDIITPPTAEPPSMTAAMIKRGGLGGIVGLVLALGAALVLELRLRIMARRGW
ncbi:MAG TPA: FHA domain-containing protein [Polyangiaceae bacterium]|nr:FHA domain-containing protein [Polyangiaceae bacterium]